MRLARDVAESPSGGVTDTDNALLRDHIEMLMEAGDPPAALSEPVLTPTNPSYPSNLSVLCTVPATGSVVLGVATMLANTGRRMARSTMRTWSAAVDTVASS